MQWNDRQARFTLLLFYLIFAAGQVTAFLTRPVYPDPGRISETWPPKGHLVDATIVNNRALELYPVGTTIAYAIKSMGLAVDPLGSGHCLPRAGVLFRGSEGWRIRPMTQQERWVWRIPMDIHKCTPEDLKRISGVGPVLALRIHDFVRKRAFLDSVDDLKEVRGVGPGKLKTLKKELEVP